MHDSSARHFNNGGVWDRCGVCVQNSKRLSTVGGDPVTAHIRRMPLRHMALADETPREPGHLSVPYSVSADAIASSHSSSGTHAAV